MVAAHHEGYASVGIPGCRNTHRLMVSSAKRVRRTMGCAHGVRIDAGADAVATAVFVEEEGGGCVQVLHRGAIGLEACAEV